jgi:predicted nucleotidyltransferase
MRYRFSQITILAAVVIRKRAGFSLLRGTTAANLGKAEMNITELREAIRSAFRGKPVSRVDLFGSAARGEMTPESDVDILVTPKPEATRRDLFIMAAEVEDAVGRRVDFLIRADVEAIKNHEARDLILKSGVPVYVA